MNTAVASIDKTETRSVLVSMSHRYGMEPVAFEATLRATVVPKEVSREQFAAFLLVAKEYGLNPLTKEIFAFPTRAGGVQPVVSVDGWANLINSHPACDGFEFEDSLDDKGNLVSITCRIYRKDRSRTISATEYMVECKRNTDTWKQWPRRMLRHKALIQAARYAFGFSGIIDPDEWERHPEREDAPRTQRQPMTVVSPPANGERKPLPPIAGEPSGSADSPDHQDATGDGGASADGEETQQAPQGKAGTKSRAKPAVIDAEPGNPTAPSPSENPDAFLKFIRQRIKEATTAEALAAVQADYVTPVEAELFPPDADEIDRLFEQRAQEIGE